jgi:hypothetical protein
MRSPIGSAPSERYAVLLTPYLSGHFVDSAPDLLMRFCFRFEIADVLRQPGGAREADIRSASALHLDSFECRIADGIGHTTQWARSVGDAITTVVSRVRSDRDRACLALRE